MDRNSLPYSDELHWRFSSFVEFADFLECWPWKGTTDRAKNRVHYEWGVMYVKSQKYKASRVSWMLNRGPIPDGLYVLHMCDNSLCVNPGHLYLGTQKENVDDMDRKGRRVNGNLCGERHGRSKLTAGQVIAIRNSNAGASTLAARFSTSQTNVWLIRTGKAWKHLL